MSTTVESSSDIIFPAAFTLAFLALATLVGWVRSLAQLQSSPGWQTFFLLMWAELVDLVLVIGGIGAVTFLIGSAVRSDTAAVTALTLAAAVTLAIRTMYLALNGKTVGLQWAGLGLIRTPTGSIGWLRALARESLFLIWCAANVFALIPWLLFSSIACWVTGRTLPDFVMRLNVLPESEVVREIDVPFPEMAMAPGGSAAGSSS